MDRLKLIIISLLLMQSEALYAGNIIIGRDNNGSIIQNNYNIQKVVFTNVGEPVFYKDENTIIPHSKLPADLVDSFRRKYLVGKIQITMKNARCYSGKIDAIWGSASSEAWRRLISYNQQLPKNPAFTKTFFNNAFRSSRSKLTKCAPAKKGCEVYEGTRFCN